MPETIKALNDPIGLQVMQTRQPPQAWNQGIRGFVPSEDADTVAHGSGLSMMQVQSFPYSQHAVLMMSENW